MVEYDYSELSLTFRGLARNEINIEHQIRGKNHFNKWVLIWEEASNHRTGNW